MKILAINNGHYNYKSGNEIFKACCKKSLYKKMKCSIDTLEYDGEVYSIGIGNPILKFDKTITEETKILILSMLCKFTNDKKESFKLVLSCPPLAYEDHSQQMPMYLRGKYDVLWNGDKKCIEIEDVIVLPETFAVHSVNNINGRYNDKVVFVIDIGGFTTNVCMIDNGLFTPNDFITMQHGMWHLDFKISQYLSGRYSINCKTEDMPRFRKEGLFLDQSNTNFMEVEKDAINDMYCEFIDKIIQKCSEKDWNISLENYEKLVTGGGGQILFPIIKEVFLPNAELSDDPIYDNYKGLNAIAKELY